MEVAAWGSCCSLVPPSCSVSAQAAPASPFSRPPGVPRSWAPAGLCRRFQPARACDVSLLGTLDWQQPLPCLWAPSTELAATSATCVLTALWFALCPSLLDGTCLWSLAGPCSDVGHWAPTSPEGPMPVPWPSGTQPTILLCVGHRAGVPLSSSAPAVILSGSFLAVPSLFPTSRGMCPSAQVGHHGGA